MKGLKSYYACPPLQHNGIKLKSVREKYLKIFKYTGN